MKDCRVNKYNSKVCCEQKEKNPATGIIYGIIPHTFCILYILFSVIGFTAGTTFFARFFGKAYFFPLILSFSVALFAVSTIFFLFKKKELSFTGIKNNRKQIAVSASALVLINLAFIFVIFPWSIRAKANFSPNSSETAASLSLSLVKIKVKLPCVGHAPLISDELKKLPGITKISFDFKDTFTISYDPEKTTEEEILNLPILKEFKATKI